MTNVFEVEWTGSYPNLCHGSWVITYKGVPVKLPEDLISSEMNTEGTYSSWHFDDNWSEVFEDYEDGLEFDSWIKSNKWVLEVTKDIEEQKELFSKIQEQDWRQGSCGGCI